MSFIRVKRSHGREYAYEVENFRDVDGQTRQRVLRYLGPIAPVYGGHGAVDLHDAKTALRERRRRNLDPAGDGGA